MIVKSLVSELTGQVPVDADMTRTLAAGRRLLIIFEDASGAQTEQQNELLSQNRQALLSLNIATVQVPPAGNVPLLDGKPIDLPLTDLHDALGVDRPGAFGIVLVNADGHLILRAAGPVTSEQIKDAIDRVDPTPIVPLT
jgi:hypothetical protein